MAVRFDSFLPTSYTYRTHPSEVNNIWKNRVQVQYLDAFLLPFDTEMVAAVRQEILSNLQNVRRYRRRRESKNGKSAGNLP